MRVAITGASGLLGTALTESLIGAGHQVLRIVRRTPATADELRWSPEEETIDLDRIAGVDAIVHLAGESISSGRWNEGVKRRIIESRVQGTRTIANAVNQLATPPSVVISASAVGYYGSRDEEVLDESSPPGTGFVADTGRAWEAEIDRIEPGRSRVVKTRFGVILARRGGALQRMLPLYQLGLGGPLAGGRQWMAWITLEDAVRALRFALDSSLSGPVNVVAPEPARNTEFNQALAEALGRPAFMPVPGFALRLMLGEMADELLLTSQRVVPRQLLEHGFEFRHPTIRVAFAALFASARPQKSSSIS